MFHTCATSAPNSATLKADQDTDFWVSMTTGSVTAPEPLPASSREFKGVGGV